MNKHIFLFAALSLCAWGCRSTQTDAPVEQNIKVKTQKAIRYDAPAPSYIGTLEESVSIPLSFSTIGTVENILVTEGTFVQKGQLLAVLNNSNLENTYQMALSNQKKAEDAYKRLSEIYKKGSLPAVKFVEIETALEQSKAATQIALKNKNDSRLFAPEAGVISKRSIELGANLMPGATALTLVKIDKVYIKVPIPEQEVGQIHKGQKASANVLALNNALFTGVIEEIGVVANPVTHTYAIKIAVQNKDRQLKPGMVCRVVIDNMLPSGGVVVPVEAVQVDARGQKSVFIKTASGKVLRKAITTGALNKEGIIVTQGLSEADEVIVEGFQKVSDGMNIETAK